MHRGRAVAFVQKEASEMIAPRTVDAITPPTVAPSAVVWIDEHLANVAMMSHDGRISTCEINRGWLREPAYLAQVVRVIGDRPRVVILGPSSIRLALEREYVSILGRPDRLIDVEPATAFDADDLLQRLRALAA
jgi:hypothetical protein